MPIQSPIFYMGNKYDLLPQLRQYIPEDIDTFYDLFGGSGVMSLNVNSNSTVYNEMNENIVGLLKIFKNCHYEQIVEHIQNRINEFNLPDMSCDVRVKHFTEKYKEEHNENYLRFRSWYNKTYCGDNQDWSTEKYLDLYTLTYFSFCNLIRFNSKGEFNMPFGNRCWLPEHKNKIGYACEVLQKKNIQMLCGNALEKLKDIDQFKQGDFVYLDPPYTNTMAIYNEKRAFGGWDIEDDMEMFELLDKLTQKGIRWGVSNVYVNKGLENTHLREWAEKNNYKVFHLNKEYASLGKGASDTDEVYICNYQPPFEQITLDLF